MTYMSKSRKQMGGYVRGYIFPVMGFGKGLKRELYRDVIVYVGRGDELVLLRYHSGSDTHDAVMQLRRHGIKGTKRVVVKDDSYERGDSDYEKYGVAVPIEQLDKLWGVQKEKINPLLYDVMTLKWKDVAVIKEGEINGNE